MANSIEELGAAIREAVKARTRTPEMEAFLEEARTTLPHVVLLMLDASHLFLDIRDIASTRSDSRTLCVGEEPRPKNTRNHKHGNFDWRFETQSVKAIAYIDFRHPRIGEFWTDARNCAVAAAITAVVAAILAEDFETAHRIFYPSFYACLTSRIGDRAQEVEIDYRRVIETGCWENHCG